jgi:hypothetical protein
MLHNKRMHLAALCSFGSLLPGAVARQTHANYTAPGGPAPIEGRAG